MNASGASVLVVGDSYMNADVFRHAFSALPPEAAVDFRTIDVTWPGAADWPMTGVRESEGSPEQIDQWLAGHTILAVHGAPVTRELLERNPSVKFVACARGGPVNVDLAAARELGVVVTTTPGKNAAAVADLTIGFLVHLWRNLGDSTQHVRELAAQGLPMGESTFEGARWFGRELSQRSLGLIGLGHVARLVAQRATALGIEVIAFDPFVPDDAIPGVTRATSLDSLLPRVEAVSLHARATAENRHLLGAKQIAQLPAGAVVINTARESLVDEHALLAALRSGHLAGAAMDVLEPDGPWRALAADSRVLLTPHIGGATYETLGRGAQMLCQEITRYLAKEPLRWAAV